MKISRYFDAAVLDPAMTREDAVEAMKAAIAIDSYSICVRPCDIELALDLCKGTNTVVSCVLDFPHGDATSKAKAAMAADYASLGVAEIDMVANFGFIRSGMWEEMRLDVEGVVRAAAVKNVPVKVILETCYLDEQQIRQAVRECIKAGAAFVKTSTGFGTSGASVEAVGAMVDEAAGKIRVKASGGIRDLAAAKNYVEMGASRLGVGVSSAVKIASEE